MRNNNSSVVRKLVLNNMCYHCSQYRFILLSIVIASMLLTSVFSIGVSYYHSLDMQQLRLMGTTAHAGLTNPTKAQQMAIPALDYVKSTGLSLYVAPVNNVRTLSLYWYDRNEWVLFRSPAFSNVEGNYPQAENEIMGSRYALAQLGVMQPAIGQEVTVQYLIGNTVLEKTFVLSGYYDSDLNIRSEGQDFLLVSDLFVQNSCICMEENSSLSILFLDHRQTNGYAQRLSVDAQVTDKQILHMVPRYDVSSNAQRMNMVALGLVILFIILTAFLLIHNIMEMMVSQQVRFFGQLKTLGTTAVQIRQFVIGNAVILSLVGIPVGLLLATTFSQALTPYFLSRLSNLPYGAEVSVSPLIYLSASLFSLLTVVLGVWKPARIAASYSPIEAVRFISEKAQQGEYASVGLNVGKLALRTLHQNKARTLLVVTSLFLGMTLFTLVVGAIGSLDADRYASDAVENDFIVEAVTPELAKRVESDATYTNFQTNYVAYMDLTPFPALDTYFREEKQEAFRATNTVSFVGYLVGIDERALDSLGLPTGEYAYICTDRPELFTDVASISFRIMRTGENGLEAIGKLTLPVGGFVPTAYRWASESMVPNIYLSNSSLLQIMPDAQPYSVQFDVEEQREAAVYRALTAEISVSPSMKLSSRINAKERLRQMQNTLYILGGGIAILLALVGLLNFINLISANIVRRRVEFAMLESIGMTHRQLRRLVIDEGISYAGLAVILSGTLGTMLVWFLLRLFSNQVSYALFKFPVIPYLASAAVLCVLSLLIPMILFKNYRRTSLIERLRGVE